MLFALARFRVPGVRGVTSERRVLHGALLVSLLTLVYIASMFKRFQTAGLSHEQAFGQCTSTEQCGGEGVGNPRRFMIGFGFAKNGVLPLDSGLGLATRGPAMNNRLYLRLPS